MQEIQTIVLDNTFNTHNTLHHTMFDVHSKLGEYAHGNVLLRNTTLKTRLSERRTDVVTLPIHEFKYEIRLFSYLHIICFVNFKVYILLISQE